MPVHGVDFGRLRFKRRRPMRFVYEERVLAYIDILGWKELIERSAKDFSVMATVTKAVESLIKHADFVRNVGRAVLIGKGLQLTVFSDTVVLSCRSNPRAAYFLLSHAQKFCLDLMEAGVYTRGAIVRGPLFHRGGVIFGPALVEAHTLETAVARHPRILVADSIIFGRGVSGTDGGYLPDAVLLEDEDTLRILNPFVTYPFRAPIPDDELRRIRKRVARDLSVHEASPGIRSKLGWLLKFVDRQLAREVGRKTLFIRGEKRVRNQRVAPPRATVRPVAGPSRRRGSRSGRSGVADPA
jgi:hypothetical protein